MSTDVYIDTHSNSFDEFDKLENKTFEECQKFSKHESRKILQIGHINDLSYSPYNIYVELLNINWLFNKLTENLIVGICNRYQLFFQSIEIVNSTKNWDFKDQLSNYGCNEFHEDNPIIDFVSLQTLLQYLNDNKNKYWQVRVD